MFVVTSPARFIGARRGSPQKAAYTKIRLFITNIHSETRFVNLLRYARQKNQRLAQHFAGQIVEIISPALR